MSEPLAARTIRDYLRRYRQLTNVAKTMLGRDFNFTNFATLLINKIGPNLSVSSWRQYRSATVYGLKEARKTEPHREREIDAAVSRLLAARPSGKRRGKPRTSQKKAKSLPDGDLDAIRRLAMMGRSPNGQALSDFLLAAELTGLRPCEWPGSRWRSSQEKGIHWELIVVCAKNTRGRAHGPVRTLRFGELDQSLINAVTGWIAVARKAERAGRYDRLMKTLGELTAEYGKRLFPRRKKRPTPYTPRHLAAARWKAHYVQSVAPEQRESGRAIVAALLGHATDETASHHYARPDRRNRGGRDLPIPAADPAEVARVRKVFSHKFERMPNRRKDDGLQPSW